MVFEGVRLMSWTEPSSLAVLRESHSWVRNDIVVQILCDIQVDGDVPYITIRLFDHIFALECIESREAAGANATMTGIGDAGYVRDPLLDSESLESSGLFLFKEYFTTTHCNGSMGIGK
jgi:hypothetical protein